jgi:hypothetical protein
MVLVGLRSVSMQWMATTAPVAVMALTLAMSAASGADDAFAAVATPEAGLVAPPAAAGPDAPAPAGNVKPETSNADNPKARVHRPPAHHTPGQGIDDSVRRLTRSLDLDSAQQAKLREILWDHHRQVMKLRNEDSTVAVDRTGATLALLDRTKARIRDILNEEQRKKYSVDVPRDQTAPAQADLQHWMQLQDSQRQQGDVESK